MSKSLSSFEIACVTNGVPATGDLEIDNVILMGVKFKASVEVLTSLITGKSGHITDYDIQRSVETVERLMNIMDERTKKNDKKR